MANFAGTCTSDNKGLLLLLLLLYSISDIYVFLSFAWIKILCWSWNNVSIQSYIKPEQNNEDDNNNLYRTLPVKNKPIHSHNKS